MSTLNVSNITDGTTTVGTSYVVNGSAKAWCNFNGTGTIAIQDSLNVSSLTDDGTGTYQSLMTNSMAAANYVAFGGGDVNNANNDLRRNVRLFRIETGLVKIACGINANSDTKEDWTNVYTSAFGDLA